MSSGGGNAQSGTTQYNWNPQMEGRWTGLLDWAGQEAARGYTPYGEGPTGASRTAGFNNDQYTGFQRMRDLADSGGPQDTWAGRNQNQRTAEGAYLSGDGANPYAGATNQYAGQSPQFQQMLRSGQEDITNAYNQGTSADTTRMFNMAGAFGGSAHQNAMANNQSALAKQLGQYTAGMQNDQYGRSAGLEESRLGRGSSAYEGERGRMLQGAQGGLQGQGLSMDLISQLLGTGATQQGQTQRGMDDAYARWAEAMNFNRNNVGWLGNLLGQAQGSTGSQTTQSGYSGGTNLGAGLLGAGMAGRGLGLF